LISLPMFHGMTDQDVEDVIAAVNKVVTAYQVKGERSESLAFSRSAGEPT